ncbi:MAG: 16S rRNA (adenine(1518)-N(6)/adenine(1519)-N(6))-dimethyltransferase RsmA [Firmicutes bacterium]|nr:16S rRNA (adenine(1518)-N(6)/adenine(1519)-N(6))-dimethyltransferase RsmA [Bacillota bacterium]
MNFKDLTVPSRVAEIIKEHEFRFKKKFGQNFLVDKNILDKICDAADLTESDFVLEIGPGIGTLTNELSKRCKKVVAIEIDRDLTQILKETITADNVDIVEGDALQLDWQEILRKSGWQKETVKLVANLPYYLTSALIMKALEGEVPFQTIVVMVQKEVAERMTAQPGTKAYGILSLAVQYYSQPQLVTNVSRRVFFPAPDVDSAVVKLQSIEPPVDVASEELFMVIRAAFGQRRKNLKNTLKNLTTSWNIAPEKVDEIFHQLGIPVNARGETLSLQKFGELTRALIHGRNFC